MCSTSIDNSVQDALDQIIISEGLGSETQIKVNQGSEAGDGYGSKTYAATLIGKRRTINLFIKYFPSNNGVPTVIQKAFDSETMFYEVIYPAVLNFQIERSIKDAFCNVPKSYHVGHTRGLKPVVLENIKLIGYDLRNRQQPIDDEHMVMALKTFAKFHAVSYAMKDQQPEAFEELASNVGDVMRYFIVDCGFDTMIEGCIRQFIKHFEAGCNKKILDNIDGLCENLIDFCRNSHHCFDKYSIILQGDCWPNNAMYLYEENKTKPLDIKLVDWQMIRVNTPVLDISYFFYTIATKEMMNNLEKYQKIYHDALYASIRELGSDPENMFPYDVYKQHWKKYSKFGFALAFLVIKGMLSEKDEVPNVAESLGDVHLQTELFSKTIKNEDKYQKRIKDIFEHFVDNNFL